jgi:hypothetical protein
VLARGIEQGVEQGIRQGVAMMSSVVEQAQADLAQKGMECARLASASATLHAERDRLVAANESMHQKLAFYEAMLKEVQQLGDKATAAKIQQLARSQSETVARPSKVAELLHQKEEQISELLAQLDGMRMGIFSEGSVAITAAESRLEQSQRHAEALLQQNQVRSFASHLSASKVS